MQLLSTATLLLLLGAVGVRAQYSSVQLQDDPESSQDYVGWATAASGSVVVVGAPQCFIPSITPDASLIPAATTYGNGYVNVYSCTSDAVCSFESIITAPTASEYDGAWYFTGSCFGYSLALTNGSSLLIVGAPNAGYEGKMTCFEFLKLVPQE